MATKIDLATQTKGNLPIAELPIASANSLLLGSGASGSGSAFGNVTLASSLSFAGTVLGVASSGVTAGTYTNATVVVDATGRVTSASSGSAGSGQYVPIQILQSASATGNPSLTPVFSRAVLTGSCIVVCIGIGSASVSSVTDSAGNTYTAYASTSLGVIYVATNVIGGSITVTIAGPFGNATIFELSNVATVEGSSGNTATSATSVGTGSASSVYPFEFVLMTAFTTNASPPSITNANSWPSVGSTASLFGTQAEFATTISTAGSISNTANFSASGNIYAGFVILRPIMSVPNPLTTKGDLIVAGTSGVEHRLAVGSNGKVLTANSSATDGVDWETPAFQSLTTTGTSGAATLSAGVLNIPNYATGGGGGGAGAGGSYVLLSSQTASSVTELDFTSIISSTYDVYEVVLNDVTMGTSGAAIAVQFSTNNGSSWDTSSIYDWGQYNVPLGSGTNGANTQASTSRIILFSDASSIGSSSSAAPAIDCTFRLYSVNSASNHKLLSGEGVAQYNSNSNYYRFDIGGRYRNATAVNAFRVISTSGNFSGTVRVYGIANANGGNGLFAPILSTIPTRSGTGLTTAFNASGTFTQADTAMGITITDPTGTAGENIEGLVKAYPGSSYTLTTLFALAPTGSNYVLSGLVIMNTTSGALMLFGARYANDTAPIGWKLSVLNYNSPTSFNAFALSPIVQVTPSLIWLQLADNGTNITFKASTDGVYFQQLYTVSKASSFLGSSGFNFLGIAIDRANGQVGTTLASWTGA